jgi:hypothetical protein
MFWHLFTKEEIPSFYPISIALSSSRISQIFKSAALDIQIQL